MNTDPKSKESSLKRQIRKKYGSAAAAATGSSCCGSGEVEASSCCSSEEVEATSSCCRSEEVEATSSCCGPTATSSCCSPITANLYTKEELAALPQGASGLSLGCGNPTALARLVPREVVLDLGSGGGADVFLAAQRVGPGGKVYGLDMTDEMLALAHQNRQEAGVDNVEFLKGEIEDIPLPDNSVDVIISNCVVNLSLDKSRVFQEAYRVLRPGGRLAISDIVFQGDMDLIPNRVRKSTEAWVGCIAGALEEQDCLAKLAAAGFLGAAIEVTRVYEGLPLTDGSVELPEGIRVVSGFVRARKPGAGHWQRPCQ